MTIGETLAEARREAGLTVTQVSEATRVRETVIRAIERDDFSVCGGDFYARGHIRSIGRTIGIDPEPLIREYDDAHGGSPQAIRASDVFEPETPIKIAERRRPNWSAAMAVALAVVMVYALVRLLGSGSDDRGQMSSAPQSAPPAQKPASPSPSPSPSPSKNDDAVALAPRDQVVVQLRAKESCWVSVQDSDGDRRFEGLLREGAVKQWKDKDLLRLVIGNAGGAALTVNGKDLGSPGRSGEVIRVEFKPGDPERG
ncbi:MAG: DUF4115 domain-containing protein [Streptosporangiales bacterium]|nr:DUF4115 domain-containing protein [Streptosporangiales bacterium]